MYKFAKKVANHEGFTLVELIVVIAILGILAGIAIPVYSGYIKKANQAADNVLLGAVNTAFAAACVENGLNANAIPTNGVVLEYTSKGPITGLAAIGATGVDSDDINASFLRYFESNIGTRLKYYEAGQINYVKGFGFTGNGVAVTLKETIDNGDTRTYTFDVGGKEISYTVSKADIAAFQASTFGTDMTVGQLMGEVGTLTGAVSEVLNNVTADGATYKILKSIYGDDVDTLLGLTKDESGNYNKDQLGNALVLAVAKQTDAFLDSGATATALLQNLAGIAPNDDARFAIAKLAAGALKVDGVTQETAEIGDLTMDRGSAVANMALAYAMMESYVNSDASVGKTITAEGKTVDVRTFFQQRTGNLDSYSGGLEVANAVMDVLGAFSDDSGFAAYLTSAQATTDMNGYLSAMKSIAGNEGTLLNDNNILSGSFGSPEIANILNMIFSSSAGGGD